MTTLHNPYMAQNLSISASLNKFADPMEENSPTNLENTPETTTTLENQSPTSQNEQVSNKQEVIDIKEEDELLPPSYHCTIMEETLQDNDRPFVFWAMLHILIPEKLVNPMATMFEHLESFITNMLEADVHFTMFLHNLSKYKTTNDLPKLIKDCQTM